MFMLCYYIWFHPTGIEMPFFKFLKRPQSGAARGVAGPGGDAADGVDHLGPESVPLTISKVGHLFSFFGYIFSMKLRL
jgi:hypothetical protein